LARPLLNLYVGADLPQHSLVPADAIVEIDDRSRVIGLAVEREAIRSFL
jgi:hypothetical protein